MTHIRYSSSDEMRSIMKKYITLLQRLPCVQKQNTFEN